MENILKGFEGLVTNWKYDQFFKARIKLSALYVLIVFVLIGSVSLVFYDGARRQLDNIPKHFVIENHTTGTRSAIFEITLEQQKILQDIKKQTISGLITVDLTILGIIFLLSYWWAGYTLRPIKKSLEQQKRFIADASHELRTPLTVMKTALDVFTRTEKNISQTTSELVAVLDHEIKHLTTMSTQLLDLTTGDLQVLKNNIVDVEKVLQTVEKKFQMLAQEKDSTVSFQTIAGCLVVGEEHAIERVFSNIVDNALKYTPPKGSVSVRMEKKAYTVVVRISDTGVGISPQDIPNIFNRFYQSDTSKHTSGVGLGLSIVQSIVKKMGGSIMVQSTLGKGSTFTVELPRKRSS